MGDEADALNDIYEDGWEPASLSNTTNRRSRNTAKIAKLIYATTKAAKAGVLCDCPTCNKAFTKVSYQQAFCSNKGAGNCKDEYWNLVKPARQMYANRYY